MLPVDVFEGNFDEAVFFIFLLGTPCLSAKMPPQSAGNIAVAVPRLRLR